MDNATLTKHAEAILRAAGMRDDGSFRENGFIALMENRKDDILTALRAAVEEARLEGVKAGLEAAAKIAEQWRDENKVALTGQHLVGNPAEQLEGARVECNALMKEFRRIDPTTISATVGGGV